MPEPPASTSEQHHAGAELDPDAEVYAKPEESAGGRSEASVKRTNIADAVFEAEVGRQTEARTRLGHERYQDKVRLLLDAAVSPAHRVLRAKAWRAARAGSAPPVLCMCTGVVLPRPREPAAQVLYQCEQRLALPHRRHGPHLDILRLHGGESAAGQPSNAALPFPPLSLSRPLQSRRSNAPSTLAVLA